MLGGAAQASKRALPMKGNSRDNPSPQRLRLASGTPQTLRALSCTRKFVHELAFCSQVSNRPRTRLSATAADTQPRLIWRPAPATLCAATGAGGRVPSAALPGDTARCCQQPRLAPHNLNVHQPEQELAELPACSPQPRATGAKGSGQRVGAVCAPAVRGHLQRGANGLCELPGQGQAQA